MPIQPTTNELNQARSDLQERVMVDRCDIERTGGAEDDWGGAGGGGFTPVAQAVPVSVTSQAELANQAGGVVAEVDTYVLVFPHGTDVRRGDRVTVTTLGSLAFTVENVRAPESWDLAIQADGRRVV